LIEVIIGRSQDWIRKGAKRITVSGALFLHM